MQIYNPYHQGELVVQKRSNESNTAQMNGTVIDSDIPVGALRFIAQQPMAVLGSIDPYGRVWASVLFGQPGFVHALNNRSLEIDTSQQRLNLNDPLWSNLERSPNIGILIIELESRRRLRINGVAKKVSGNRYNVNVERAYPNCPKYIQRRQLKTDRLESSANSTPCTQGVKLNETQKALITHADTFFVASSNPDQGVDASHRGGKPGFVQLLNDDQLRIPDFVGNSMFNTLGNIVSYPYAGLVFIDFEGNRILQLTGRAEVLWDVDDPHGEAGGTHRFWQFDIIEWHEHTLPYNLNWEFIDYSPHNPEPLTELTTSDMLSLKVEKVQHEADNIKSFRLRAMDGGCLPPFEAGSHIQVQVQLPDHTRDLRHYSLLSDPNERSMYEIAVFAEPEGRGGSLYLHQHIHDGDVLEAKLAKNEFPMVASAEHTILIAGGIGITPIMAMLQKLATEKQSFELHYSVRKHSEFVFYDRIKQLAGDKAHFYASRETNSQRLNLDALLSTLKPRAHIYVCGPLRMITAVQETSKTHGWSSMQVHFESFGTQLMPDDQPVRIYLAKSDQTICVPADQTILDTLLNAGINIPFQCKRGECSMCLTRVLAGKPEHRDLCLNAEERKTLMLICVSRSQSKTLTLDL